MSLDDVSTTECCDAGICSILVICDSSLARISGPSIDLSSRELFSTKLCPSLIKSVSFAVMFFTDGRLFALIITDRNFHLRNLRKERPIQDEHHVYPQKAKS